MIKDKMIFPTKSLVCCNLLVQTLHNLPSLMHGTKIHFHMNGKNTQVIHVCTITCNIKHQLQISPWLFISIDFILKKRPFMGKILLIIDEISMLTISGNDLVMSSYIQSNGTHYNVY